MAKIDVEAVKRQSVSGVVALTSRALIDRVIGAVANFILTILLIPEEFGVFFVVSAAIAFLGYFSDVGLAAALIQQKKEPSRTDYITTFTIQQTLVGATVLLSLIFAPKIGSFYGFSDNGVFLFRALAIAFFLSSLKTIPSVLLERKLQFNRLVIAQIAENTAFHAVAVVLAALSFGISAFSFAALTRGVVGLGAIYYLAPWRPALGFSRASAKNLLSFGMPFQANSFIALVKDDLLIVVLGKWLPLAQVGFIGWAKRWAEMPLRLIMDSVIRVTFPAYSRLQTHPEALSRAIEKSLLFLSLLILPLSAGMMIFIRPFIEIIPRYSKWEPAVFAFLLFVVASALAALSSPLVNALNAIGRIRWTLKLMIFWTILTWVLVPLLIFRIGFNGVAVTAAIIGLTAFLPAVILRKFVHFSVLPFVIKPLAGTGIMSIVAIIGVRLVDTNIVGLALTGLASSAVYAGFMWITARDMIVPTVEKYFYAFRR